MILIFWCERTDRKRDRGSAGGPQKPRNKPANSGHKVEVDAAEAKVDWRKQRIFHLIIKEKMKFPQNGRK